MNIIEALEANKTHKVIDPGGVTWLVGQLEEAKTTPWPSAMVFGLWSIVNEPREVFINLYRNAEYFTAWSTLRAALSYKDDSSVETRKFVEVIV